MIVSLATSAKPVIFPDIQKVETLILVMLSLIESIWSFFCTSNYVFLFSGIRLNLVRSLFSMPRFIYYLELAMRRQPRYRQRLFRCHALPWACQSRASHRQSREAMQIISGYSLSVAQCNRHQEDNRGIPILFTHTSLHLFQNMDTNTKKTRKNVFDKGLWRLWTKR